MLTIFACPKPFTDPHIALIQRNAIRSWTLLQPRPTVILAGDEPGVADICAELGLVHLNDIQRNEFHTPLLNDVFQKVEARTGNPFLCYVNSDIILTGAFVRSLQRAAASKRKFMMGGRPWNLDITSALAFDSGWEKRMEGQIRSAGQLRIAAACDFFAYPRGLWGALPPFALGRCYFDNALMWRARHQGAALVDATFAVSAIHQNHPYAQHLDGRGYWENVEAQRNRALAGGPLRLLTWKSASHTLRGDDLRRNVSGTLYLDQLRGWPRYLFWFPLLAVTRSWRHRLGLRKRHSCAHSD